MRTITCIVAASLVAGCTTKTVEKIYYVPAPAASPPPPSAQTDPPVAPPPAPRARDADTEMDIMELAMCGRLFSRMLKEPDIANSTDADAIKIKKKFKDAIEDTSYLLLDIGVKENDPLVLKTARAADQKFSEYTLADIESALTFCVKRIGLEKTK